jgi:hypothetical protein
MNTDSFNYENTEIKQFGGVKIVRKVSIKSGRGHKSISKFSKGKKIHSVKKPIHNHHLRMIKKGKFVKGLFNDCINCNKTRKNH